MFGLGEQKENERHAHAILELQSVVYEFSNETKDDAQKVSAHLDHCEADTSLLVHMMERRALHEETLCWGGGLTRMLNACHVL